MQQTQEQQELHYIQVGRKPPARPLYPIDRRKWYPNGRHEISLLFLRRHVLRQLVSKFDLRKKIKVLYVKWT